jgi:hypothetical protein
MDAARVGEIHRVALEKAQALFIELRLLFPDADEEHIAHISATAAMLAYFRAQSEEDYKEDLRLTLRASRNINIIPMNTPAALTPS